VNIYVKRKCRMFGFERSTLFFKNSFFFRKMHQFFRESESISKIANSDLFWYQLLETSSLQVHHKKLVNTQRCIENAH